MLQIYQIITIWKYLNKLFLFTSQKRQNKRGHFKASFYSSPLFYPIAPTKPIVQLIRAYFTPISSMQNNQCEVLYPNCEPTSHFSPSFQSKMRSKWEALWFFVFLPVLLYLLYINIIRVIGFTFRISSYRFCPIFFMWDEFEEKGYSFDRYGSVEFAPGCLFRSGQYR